MFYAISNLYRLNTIIQTSQCFGDSSLTNGMSQRGWQGHVCPSCSWSPGRCRADLKLAKAELFQPVDKELQSFVWAFLQGLWGGIPGH